LADGAANHRVIANGAVHQTDMTDNVRRLLNKDVNTDSFAGAYYSIAKYDVGDTNQGAIATVACDNETDVAVAGGVQSLGLGGHPAATASSFPGRMDWNTNSPRDGRLDGWIVQFDATTAPEKVNVWALCVPNSSITARTTYTESAN
jgi:hypothetical protein